MRILVLVAALAFATCGPSRPAAAAQAGAGGASIEERLKRASADLFSSVDRTARAIEELKAILAIDSRSAEAHFLLGLAYRKQGSPELLGEAVAELRQAIALNPGFVQARFYLAQVYLDLGRTARAREELEAALAQAPRQPQLLASLGEVERQSGNAARALELARQALAADESFAQARYYAGLALFDLGRRDEAIRELERVLNTGPDVADVYVNLGAAYLDAGRADAAIATLTRGVKLDPSRPDIRLQLARAYRTKGLLAEADAQLKRITPGGTANLVSPLYRHVESDFYLEQGLLRQRRGRLKEAIAAFQNGLAMDQSHGPTNRHLAEVYLLLGSYTLASDHAARAEKAGFPLADDKRKLLADKVQGGKAGGRK